MNTQWKTTGSVKRNASRPDQRCTRCTVAVGRRTMGCRCPHSRAAVVICTSASTIAAVASHTFAAIVVEKTVVTMLV